MTQYDGGQSLAIPRRFYPYLNTTLVVKLLTHYKGLYDLNRKLSCFCCFSNCFGNALNVRYIHNISHLLCIFDDNTKYQKIGVNMAAKISLSKAPGITIVWPLARTIAYKLSLVSVTNDLNKSNHRNLRALAIRHHECLPASVRKKLR